MLRFSKRLARYTHRKVGEAYFYASQYALRKEMRRLARIPRHVPGHTNLLLRPIQFVDAASMVSAYREIWQREIYSFIARTEEPAIIDCGANIGLATLYWKSKHPRARITAFEPDPDVFATLERNCSHWNAGDVKLVNAAVWDNCESVLNFAKVGADAGHVTDLESAEINIKVNTVRLHNYLHSPVDLLKIDIEGAEWRVLRDCEPLLANVRNIFVEFHSFVGKEQDLDEILSTLRKTGFRVHLTCGMVTSRPFLGLRTYSGMDQFINIFGIRS
jgi:FkbM family methyltransferase